MSKLLSQTDLTRFYDGELKKNGKHRIDEVKSILRITSETSSNSTIFLSHSHLDKKIVDKIVMLFSELQIEVYIDWMDKDMPSYTNRTTAALIKAKIDNSTKFLFLATYNALRSKWCNWELGIAYSSKGENDFAILPIQSKTGKWKGAEYLQLYPEMQVDVTNLDHPLKAHEIKINFTEGRIVNFDEWLIIRKN
jgi:hypothetical protein